MASQCLPRSQQGTHDWLFGRHDSRYVWYNPVAIAMSTNASVGCGALAVANIHNLHQLWGLLVLAGLGIGGIVVPASIITTIICPDVSYIFCGASGLSLTRR